MHVWLRQSPRALFLVNPRDGTRTRGQTILAISTAATGPIASSYHGNESSSSVPEGPGSSGSAGSGGVARAVVEMLSLADVDLSSCIRLTDVTAGAKGCLGLMNVGNGE